MTLVSMDIFNFSIFLVINNIYACRTIKHAHYYYNYIFFIINVDTYILKALLPKKKKKILAYSIFMIL